MVCMLGVCHSDLKLSVESVSAWGDEIGHQLGKEDRMSKLHTSSLSTRHQGLRPLFQSSSALTSPPLGKNGPHLPETGSLGLADETCFLAYCQQVVLSAVTDKKPTKQKEGNHSLIQIYGKSSLQLPEDLFYLRCFWKIRAGITGGHPWTGDRAVALLSLHSTAGAAGVWHLASPFLLKPVPFNRISLSH